MTLDAYTPLAIMRETSREDLGAVLDLRSIIEDSLAHLVPQDQVPQCIDDTVFLSIEELLAQHPDEQYRRWSSKPRLYMLMRMLRHNENDEAFQRLEKEGVSDFWLPLDQKTLEQLSTSDMAPADFDHLQPHALSNLKLLREENFLFNTQVHHSIQFGSDLFDDVEQVGKGGTAEVLRVKHKPSGTDYACKRIRRAATMTGQRNQLVEFQQEVRVLKSIDHHHLVKFVASFTDLMSFSLVLEPVAKDVLKSMLDRQTEDSPLLDDDLATLRHSFRCLATAIDFLHRNRVRHKDIKPSNILLSDGNIYLCDFGISRDWSKTDNSTTEGDVLKFTRRYCAPEIFDRDPRNTKSDIWSLGCVFLEIITVVKRYTIEALDGFLERYSAEACAQGLFHAPEALDAWQEKLRSEDNDSADDLVLDWITPMIRVDPRSRPTAANIIATIEKDSANIPNPNLFLSACCSGSFWSSDYNVRERLHFNLDQRNGIRNTEKFSSSHGTMSTPNGLDIVQPESKEPQGSVLLHDLVLSTTSSTPMRVSSASTANGSGGPSSTFAASSPDSKTLYQENSNPTSLVAPPATFDVHCACSTRPGEKHIFNGKLVASNMDNIQPTAQTCAHCETGKNRIQVYQSPPQDPKSKCSVAPMIWWLTRRIVVSYISGSPETRRCSSFWLPLADLNYSKSGSEVVLRWSDCNQMIEKHSGNYGQYYDWSYVPQSPNNEITIQFDRHTDVDSFLEIISTPHEDGTTIGNKRMIKLDDQQSLYIFDIRYKNRCDYLVATLITTSDGRTNSKLFVIWPEIDLDMRVEVLQVANAATYQIRLSLHNVSTPTYHSDVRGKPAVDYMKIGSFARALQLKTFLCATFVIGTDHQLPIPPARVVEMLDSLTGWTLLYFAIVAKSRFRRKRFSNQKRGRSDMFLFAKRANDRSGQKHTVTIAFRSHNETGHRWTSVRLNPATRVSCTSSRDVAITVTGKTCGRLIDSTGMTAIPSEYQEVKKNKRLPEHKGKDETSKDEMIELTITFEDSRCVREFIKIVDKYKSLTDRP